MQLGQLFGSPWVGWVLPVGFSFGFLFRYFRLKFDIGFRFRFGIYFGFVSRRQLKDYSSSFTSTGVRSYNGTSVVSTSCFGTKSPAQLRASKTYFSFKVSLDSSHTKDCHPVRLFRPNYAIKLIRAKPFWPKGSTRHLLIVGISNWRFEAIQLREYAHLLLLSCLVVQLQLKPPVEASFSGKQELCTHLSLG